MEVKIKIWPFDISSNNPNVYWYAAHTARDLGPFSENRRWKNISRNIFPYTQDQIFENGKGH